MKQPLLRGKGLCKEKKELHRAINGSLQYMRGITMSELCKKKSTLW
jgi:hypothetical protein